MALHGTMAAMHRRRAVLLLTISLLQAPASAKWWNILKEARVNRNIQLTQNEQDTAPHASFGVDVSFPMHYRNFSQTERPFGDSKQAMYENYMQGCREHFSDRGWTCDEHEEKRIALNLFQPRALENYTDTGFKKMRLSKDLFRKIRDFWETNQGAEFQESWSIGNILANHWESPTSMLDLWDESLKHGGQETLNLIREEVQSTLEEWTSQRLTHTSTYGVRIYKEGSILSPHVDRDGLVSSAIINVAQDVDKPWPLEVIDRQGNSVNVTMEPGDMVLYESHTLIHGRPYSLQGQFYANIFVHFDSMEPLNGQSCDGEISSDGSCVSQIQEGRGEAKSSSSFGVDVSFPMHHHDLTTEHRPFGDDKQTMYEEYMQGCRDFHDDMGWACDEHEEKRISLNLNQPPKLQNYTDIGFKKTRLPQSLWRKIQYFWEANQGAEYEEVWSRGNVLANYWKSPSSMLYLYDDNLWNGGNELLNEIREEVQAAVEEWTGQRMRHTSTYGVRIYKEGSILSPHVDRDGLVSSAIINVAQDVDKPWPLEVIDREGKSQNITMEPGGMVLYESHTLIHGRPYALNGRFMANMFVHFDTLGPLDEQVCEGGIDSDGSCVVEGDDELAASDSYGVDVSFPMHHHDLTDTERPFGNDKQDLYDEFMNGCREHYGDAAERCDIIEGERIWQNYHQPASLENYTDTGYKKIRAPPELWNLLENFFNANHGKEYEENWPKGDIYTNHWASPTYMIELGDEALEGGGQELRDGIWEAARPVLEEWSGKQLSATHLYGVRIYKEGSILNPHVDREGLVTSAIVNVAQDVDEPWMLEVIDRQGKAQNVSMVPGDMVLYESRTLIHGRPFPLHGNYYGNVFIHFQPIDHNEPVNIWNGYEDPEEENENEVDEESDAEMDEEEEEEVLDEELDEEEEEEWKEEEEMEECPEYHVEYASIENYLNPKLFDNPETLADIGRRLRKGDLVVIENAFLDDFAHAMHCDMNRLTAWGHQEQYLDDGFHYSHHNIYNPRDYSEMMNSTQAMFQHPDTKRFVSDLSGRDCFGDTSGSEGSASYYMPGDHSLPHTDHIRQRTVAYVWHLSKNWHPGWGGALYWGSEHINNSFLQASFNTLFLFSVSTTTSHFVTTVSPHAAEKRLSFNGWWQSSWLPSAEDNLEEMLATSEQRRDLTEDQVRELEYIVEDEESGLDPKRRADLQALVELISEEMWPTELEAVSRIAL